MHNTGFFPDCYLLSATDGCVCCFVSLTRYWEIVAVPGCPRVNRPGIITWGGRMLTLHLNYGPFRSRQIFGDIQETHFSGSIVEVHVHLKTTFPGGIGIEGSRLATIFGSPPTPHHSIIMRLASISIIMGSPMYKINIKMRLLV